MKLINAQLHVELRGSATSKISDFSFLNAQSWPSAGNEDMGRVGIGQSFATTELCGGQWAASGPDRFSPS
jgi:hypothetical protein